MSQHAKRLKKEAEQQQEDEEGWVKVTRGHKGTKARPHSEVANQRALQKERGKKKRKELMNFYTWQHRNTQKERKLPVWLIVFFICRLYLPLKGNFSIIQPRPYFFTIVCLCDHLKKKKRSSVEQSHCSQMQQNRAAT